MTSNREPTRYRALLRIFGGTSLLAIVIAVLLGSSGSEEFWPVAVPGLTTGVGTLALAVVTYQVLRDAQRDRHDQQERERRHEASLVHVSALDEVPVAPMTKRETDTIGYRVRVRNSGAYPVYNLAAHLGFSEHARQLVYQGSAGHEVQWIRCLLPDEEQDLAFSIGWAEPLYDDDRPWVDVEFRDWQGIRWVRTADHQLIDITTSSQFTHSPWTGDQYRIY